MVKDEAVSRITESANLIEVSHMMPAVKIGVTHLSKLFTDTTGVAPWPSKPDKGAAPGIEA